MSSPGSPYREDEAEEALSSDSASDGDFPVSPTDELASSPYTPSKLVSPSRFSTPMKLKKVDLRPGETPTPKIKAINTLLGFETPTPATDTTTKPKREILVSEYKLLKLSKILKGQVSYVQALKKELARVEYERRGAETNQNDYWDQLNVQKRKHRKEIQKLEEEHSEELDDLQKQVDDLTEQKTYFEEESTQLEARITEIENRDSELLATTKFQGTEIKHLKIELTRSHSGDVVALKRSNSLLRAELRKLRKAQVPVPFDQRLHNLRVISTGFKTRWQREKRVVERLRGEAEKLRRELNNREQELMRLEVKKAHARAKRYVKRGTFFKTLSVEEGL